ncbi:MAG: 2-phospho-L-lactate guanylyltransferase [Actinomycetota bacterium]|jgi:2-phospho-L-lactate guanylyltransferase|nr:2-phospho-L-lactate guanylyltransferase [Euzebyaceae bacterium]MDQ3451305.1 2-phospho-L-lactate guanylyltransferase [Actinomycetota bacterium]
MWHAEPGGIIAIVPLKALNAAKGRLATVVDPEGRRRVVGRMLRAVLSACRACGSVTDVLVVAGDEAAARLAIAAGARALVEPEPGLDAAMAAADAATVQARATLVVAADLPLATGADLDRVFAAAPGRDAVVVVAPTRDGGTGALLRRPPGVIVTTYGPGSAAAHLRGAAAEGVRGIRVEVAGLAHDVDTPAHLTAELLGP